MARTDLFASDDEPGLQGGLGELRQRLGGGRQVGDRVVRGQVQGGDPQQLTPIGQAQCVVCRALPPLLRGDRGGAVSYTHLDVYKRQP